LLGEYNLVMQSSTPRILQATTPEQIDAARGLFCEYAVSLGWDLSDSRIAHEMELLPGPYSPPRGSLMLAHVGDAPAGALGLQPVPEGCRIEGTGAENAGELKRLFVHPDYRRFGVGRALMLRAETEARARAYDSLVLTTSAEMMPLAQGLYDSLGYTESHPYRDDMPWPDIRWMRKEL
jgi:GNAT superfamily N-acetyltransferase